MCLTTKKSSHHDGYVISAYIDKASISQVTELVHTLDHSLGETTHFMSIVPQNNS